MVQEYITYIQTENLLRHWIDIQGIKESLEIELDKFRIRDHKSQKEIDECIEAQSAGNKALSGMPFAGGVSDKTGNTATTYRQAMEKDYRKTIESILNEKYHIDLVDEKLSVGFKRLNRLQQNILNEFYLVDRTWTEVIDELKTKDYYLSKQQAQCQRRTSIYKIKNISKITVQSYKIVMRLVGVE